MSFMNKIKAFLVLDKDLEVTKHDTTKTIKVCADQLKADLGAEKCNELVSHFGVASIEGVIQRFIPFYVLPWAAGLLTSQTIYEHLIKQDKKAKDISGFIPVDELVDVMKKAYELYHNTDASLDPFEEEFVSSSETLKLSKPSEPQQKALDAVLGSCGLPDFNAIYSHVAKANSAAAQTEKLRAALEKATTDSEATVKDLQARIAKLGEELAVKPFKDIEVKASGEIPSGKVEMVPANKVFKGVKSKMLVPVWTWDGKHPMVPEINPDYIFREKILMRVLYALTSNQRMYLQGHTGSGKTTLLEQVAAHLNYPFVRINFDSEITRMDLIGRDTLSEEGGNTVSKFVEGMLPTMMQTPCIGCFDEIDFCRPDVAYVMQSALENNSIRLTEDGGREIKPHPMFRMFATGNTVGQGDEHGMYQGARPQSLAFLDRFTIWAKVEYLSGTERHALIEKAAPSLPEKSVKDLNRYVTEHLQGFSKGDILQPISPRGMLAIARATEHLINSGTAAGPALKEAFYMTVLDRASEGDRATLQGIVDRIAK